MNKDLELAGRMFSETQEGESVCTGSSWARNETEVTAWPLSRDTELTWPWTSCFDLD